MCYFILTRSRHLHTNSTFKYCVYYGKDRKKYLEKQKEFTLVITTYSIVRIDWKESLGQLEGSPTLHSTVWARVVLDEGE